MLLKRFHVQIHWEREKDLTRLGPWISIFQSSPLTAWHPAVNAPFWETRDVSWKIWRLRKVPAAIKWGEEQLLFFPWGVYKPKCPWPPRDPVRPLSSSNNILALSGALLPKKPQIFLFHEQCPPEQLLCCLRRKDRKWTTLWLVKGGLFCFKTTTHWQSNNRKASPATTHILIALAKKRTECVLQGCQSQQYN